MVAKREAWNMRPEFGESVMAKMKVATYKPTSMTIAIIAEICLIFFFMNSPVCDGKPRIISS